MVSLAEVLLRHWPEYERQFGAAILASHRRAVQAIISCRTPALGGEIYRCARCGQQHFVYHSCHHRACPQCGQAEAAEWIEHRKLKLLPVPYYLITFTVPEGLRAWLRSHQRLGYGLLLKESAATLQDVASRKKYLGAQLGHLSVLHTWGRQLQFHPHVHCVVPAGGLRPDGLRWCQPPSPDFFLPQRVLAARSGPVSKPLCRLNHRAPPLRRRCGIRTGWWMFNPWAAAKRPWLISRPTFTTRRWVPNTSCRIKTAKSLSNTRTVNTANGIPLGCKRQEFLRRFFQHALPKGFQRVRYYGWLSPAATTRWQRILALLDWKLPSSEAAPTPPRLCPRCGAELLWVASLARAPP